MYISQNVAFLVAEIVACGPGYLQEKQSCHNSKNAEPNSDFGGSLQITCNPESCLAPHSNGRSLHRAGAYLKHWCDHRRISADEVR
jgi:hypothetical protein